MAMALVKCGNGITDIRGGCGGVYFTRDRSGLHVSAKPRIIQQRSPAQIKQRNAFISARQFSTDERTVSYNIYRALNNLPSAEPPLDYSIINLENPDL